MIAGVTLEELLVLGRMSKRQKSWLIEKIRQVKITKYVIKLNEVFDDGIKKR